MRKFYMYCGLLILLMLCLPCDGIFKKLKQKFKKLFKKPKIEITLLNDNQLEYPGGDPLLLQEIRAIWKEYYDCLERQKARIKEKGSVVPHAIMIFEGTSTRMKCDVCLSPNEADTPVTWHYIPAHSTAVKPLEYGEHLLVSPNKTLTIYNAKSSDSGQYLCLSGETVYSAYFLDVTNDEHTRQVKPQTAPKSPYREPDQVLPQSNLKLFTKWSEWSPCSICGLTGKRVRYGICTVQLISPDAFNENTQNETSLRIFEEGLPCRSYLLSHHIKNLKIVQQRKSEVMTGFCKIPCPGPMLFELKDSKGNVLEIANNSAGIYSTVQGIPSVKPPVERANMYENTKSNIVLKCPGNLNSDSPIQWKLGEADLNPVLIGQQSSGRIYIDLRNYIHISDLRLSDAGIYSCWQNNELAGTIKLSVVKKMRFTFNHHLVLLGTVIIMGTIVTAMTRGVALKMQLQKENKEQLQKQNKEQLP